jgi:transposase
LVSLHPELRERFGSAPRTALAARAAALRPRRDRDPVLYATKLAMRSLGRRVLAVDDEIARLDVALAELVTATAPGLLGPTASVSTPPPSSASPPATTPNECAAKPHGRTYAVSHPSRQPLARSPAATGSTGAGTAKPTMRSGASCSPDSAPTPARSYVTRRLDEGLNRPEIIRSLKRYVARETYRHLPR